MRRDEFPIVDKYVREQINDELEKIKAEIIEYRRKNNCGVMECLDIIDEHLESNSRL